MNLQYGKITTKEENEDGTTSISRSSFHKGKGTTKHYLEVPTPVKDKSSALTVILKGLDLISVDKTRNVTFTIETDFDHRFKSVTTIYEVQE